MTAAARIVKEKARLDQLWAKVEEQRDRATRIALQGPGSEDDIRFVQGCMHLVAAELWAREGDRREIEP